MPKASGKERQAAERDRGRHAKVRRPPEGWWFQLGIWGHTCPVAQRTVLLGRHTAKCEQCQCQRPS